MKFEQKKNQPQAQPKSDAIFPKPPFPQSLFANPRPYPEKRLVYIDGKIYPQTIKEPNVINNSKYTFKSFLPLVLYHQFRYFFNLFFLLIALSQLIDMLKVGFLFTYLAPLILVLGFTMLKQAYDDMNRKSRDEQTNNQTYTILKKTGRQQTTSMNIKVGDIIQVRSNQRIPADLIILSTGDEDGSVFIRTDQLDGETDWKLRKSIKFTQNYSKNSNILTLGATVQAEAPKLDIYNFQGVFKVQNVGFQAQRQALSLNNTLWGNCFLASGKAVGLVIYTGRQMRSVMNTRQARTKVGRIDTQLNYLSKVLFIFMCILAIIIVVVGGLGQFWLLDLFRQVLLLSSIIPISMRVNLDFAKAIFSYKINQDSQILGTLARNSQIPQQLGRVQYILSDKTGTLTQNDMIFKKISINQVGCFQPHQQALLAKIVEKNYINSQGPMKDIEQKVMNSIVTGKKIKYTKRDKHNIVRDLVTCLAVCHNVTPSIQNNVKVYQASSPDEVALVKIAQKLNLNLYQRDSNFITIRNPLKQLQKFKIEAIFPFTSQSKRMGIIVRHVKTNRIIFYLKGADTVMKDKVAETLRGFVLDECEDLSREGLRTLVLAQKYLQQKQFKQWQKNYQEATLSMVNRESNVRKVIQSLQFDMQLLGITGVQDKLQQNIRQTLQSLRNAGISVWMITGDKIQTATCIAISAGLKSPTNQIFFIREQTEVYHIQNKLNEFSMKMNTVLVIDGISINTALAHQKQFFFTVAANAPAVVCCRVSPTQKATLTQGVKTYTKQIVLGIGDGGNDVGMIQAADIGVGIVGKQGKQAALASDFSILKFKYISKLLLWHGRLAYKNTSVMSQFVIHRGLIISIIQTIFSLVFYSIAIPIYNGYLMLGYTTLYTMFPVFCIIFDEDVDQNKAKDYPQLYQSLQKGRQLNYKTFLIWVWKSIYQGSVIMFLSFTIFQDSFVEIVTITFTSLIIAELLNIYTILTRLNTIVLVSQILTFIIYIASIILFREYIDVSFIDFNFIKKVFLMVLLSWGPIHILKMIRAKYDPTQNEKIMKDIKIK